MRKLKYKNIERAAQKHDLAKFKLTARQLAAIAGVYGFTGLHLAAHYGCLDQIVGGATAAELEDCLTDWRTSALYLAIAGGYMDQIRDGVTAEDLLNTKEIADFAVGMVAGTAGELSRMSNEEFMAQAKAMSTNSRKIPQRTGLHWVAGLGGLNRVVGGVTFGQLNGLKDMAGNSALSMAAENGHLDEILGGVTAEQLASVIEADGMTALHRAAMGGHLDQILDGATFEQLITVTDQTGDTPLHVAAAYNCLDQIKNSVTAEQLASVRNQDGVTGLHLASSYRHIRGGVTVDQLTRTKNNAGISALTAAAYFGCLGQITGGVTAGQLAADSDALGDTALHVAAYHCCLDQIDGGVTITQLSVPKNSDGQSPLDIALVSHHFQELFDDGSWVSFWNGLDAREQEILRHAFKDHPIPAELAELAGSGTPARQFTINRDGFAGNTNVTWDNVKYDTLPVTRSLEILNLSFPLAKKLFCPECQTSSRVLIQNPDCRRYYCPICGAVHGFDAAEYERQATRRLKSMRRVFPWTVKTNCHCGAAVEHTLASRADKQLHCPQCGSTCEVDYAGDDKALFECMKMWLAKGLDSSGWSQLPAPKTAMPKPAGPPVTVPVAGPVNSCPAPEASGVENPLPK